MATRKTPKATSDLATLSDDALIGLIVAARQEAQRRGLATEAESWATALADDERSRIAREAAEFEARRLADEEARRIAREAAEKVRREAERARAEEDARKHQDQAAKLRALAIRARELFGSDQSDFRIEVWEKAGDRRVYIGGGYEANWIEYYQTGNARIAPDTIKAPVAAVVSDLATHLGVSADEARAQIKQFCADVCAGWKTLRLEVTPDNAPRDPACEYHRWLVWDGDTKRPWYLKGTTEHVSERSAADRFETEEAAIAARAASNRPDWKVIQRSFWRAFPVKGGAQ